MVRLQRADIKAKQHKDLSKFELSFHANREFGNLRVTTPHDVTPVNRIFNSDSYVWSFINLIIINK